MKIVVCELDTHVRHVLVGQYAGRISVGDDSDRWFVWQIFDANGIAAVAAGVADALAKQVSMSIDANGAGEPERHDRFSFLEKVL